MIQYMCIQKIWKLKRATNWIRDTSNVEGDAVFVEKLPELITDFFFILFIKLRKLQLIVH